MYRYAQPKTTKLKVNQGYTGETIEAKMRRILNNKEPITDGSPLIYTERKDGVMPGYNIRTDRWEVAIDAMERVTKDRIAKREQRLKTDIGDEAAKNMKKESGETPANTRSEN